MIDTTKSRHHDWIVAMYVRFIHHTNEPRICHTLQKQDQADRGEVDT